MARRLIQWIFIRGKSYTLATMIVCHLLEVPWSVEWAHLGADQ